MRISDCTSDLCSSDLTSLRRHVCHAATKPIGSRAVGANDAQVAAKLNKHHVHTGEENVDVSAQTFFALILAAEPGRQFTILIQRKEHRTWTAVKMGRASCRESVGESREITGGGGKKKKKD